MPLVTIISDIISCPERSLENMNSGLTSHCIMSTGNGNYLLRLLLTVLLLNQYYIAKLLQRLNKA